MVYYMVDEEKINNFSTNAGLQRYEVYRATAEEIGAKVRADNSDKGYLESYIRSEVRKAKLDYSGPKMKHDLVQYLADSVVLNGTRKDDVCRDACRKAEAMGLTEAHIIRPSYVSFYNDIVQHWYVYKEDGVWYQKMDKSCKARHEVEL